MLVLSRKHLEKVIITVPPCDEPTQVIVHVVEIQKDKAKLGFQAKPSVEINREEIHYKLHGIPVEEQIKEAMVRR
jgi:carbon storage regulator CsrA